MNLKEKWNALSDGAKKKALASAIVGGIVAIAVGFVTYFVEDDALRTKINEAITLTSTFVLTMCNLFIKE